MLQLDRGEGQDYLDETGGCGVTVTRLDSWVAGPGRQGRETKLSEYNEKFNPHPVE